MMTNPPIDKLITKASCRYELVMGVVARAKQIIAQEPDRLIATKIKPISLAANEIYDGEVEIKRG